MAKKKTINIRKALQKDATKRRKRKTYRYNKGAIAKKFVTELLTPEAGSPSVENNTHNRLRHIEATCAMKDSMFFVLPSLSLVSTMLRKNNASVKDALGEKGRAAALQAKQAVHTEAQDKLEELASKAATSGLSSEIVNVKGKSDSFDISLDRMNIDLGDNLTISDMMVSTVPVGKLNSICPKEQRSDGPLELSKLTKPMILPVEYNSTKHVSTAFGKLATYVHNADVLGSSFADAAIWKSYLFKLPGGSSKIENLVISKYLLDTASLASDTLRVEGNGTSAKLGGIGLLTGEADLLYKRKSLFSINNITSPKIPSGLKNGKYYKPGLDEYELGRNSKIRDPWKEPYWNYTSNVFSSTTIAVDPAKLLVEKIDKTPPSSHIPWTSIMEELKKFSSGDSSELNPVVASLLPSIVRTRKDPDGSYIVNSISPIDAPELFGGLKVLHYEKPPLAVLKSNTKKLEPQDLETVFKHDRYRAAGIPDSTSKLLEFGFGADGYVPINDELRKLIRPQDYTSKSTVYDIALLGQMGRVMRNFPSTLDADINEYSVFVKSGSSEEVEVVHHNTAQIITVEMPVYEPYITHVSVAEIHPNKSLDDNGEMIDNVLKKDTAVFKPGIVIDRLPYENPNSGEMENVLTAFPKEGEATPQTLFDHMARESARNGGNTKYPVESRKELQEFVSLTLGDSLNGSISSKVDADCEPLKAFKGPSLSCFAYWKDEPADMNVLLEEFAITSLGQVLLAALFAPYVFDQLDGELEFDRFLDPGSTGGTPSSDTVTYEAENIVIDLPYGDFTSTPPKSSASFINNILDVFKLEKYTTDGGTYIPIGIMVEDDITGELKRLRPEDLFTTMRSLLSNTSIIIPSGDDGNDGTEIVSDKISDLKTLNSNFKIIYRISEEHPRFVPIHMYTIRHIAELYAFLHMLSVESKYFDLPDVTVDGIPLKEAIAGKPKAETGVIFSNYLSVLSEMYTLAQITDEKDGTKITPMYPVLLDSDTDEDTTKVKDDFIVVKDVALFGDTPRGKWGDTLVSGAITDNVIPGLGYRVFTEDASGIVPSELERRVGFYGTNKTNDNNALATSGYLAKHDLDNFWNNAVTASERLLKITTESNRPVIGLSRKITDTGEIIAPPSTSETVSVVENMEIEGVKGPLYFEIDISSISIRPVVTRNLYFEQGGTVQLYPSPRVDSNLLSWLPWRPSAFSVRSAGNDLSVSGTANSPTYTDIKVTTPLSQYLDATLRFGKKPRNKAMSRAVSTIKNLRDQSVGLLTVGTAIGTGTEIPDITSFTTLKAAGKIKSIIELSGFPVYVSGRTDNRRYFGLAPYPITTKTAETDFFGGSSDFDLDELSTENMHYQIMHPRDDHPLAFIWSQSEISISKRRAIVLGATYLESILRGLKTFKEDAEPNETETEATHLVLNEDRKNPLAGLYKIDSKIRPPKGYKSDVPNRVSRATLWVYIPDINESINTDDTLLRFRGSGGLFAAPTIEKDTPPQLQLTYFDNRAYAELNSGKFEIKDVRKGMAERYTRDNLDIYASMIKKILEVTDSEGYEDKLYYINLMLPSTFDSSTRFAHLFTIPLEDDDIKLFNYEIEILEKAFKYIAKASGGTWLQTLYEENKLWIEGEDTYYVSIGMYYWLEVFQNALTNEFNSRQRNKKQNARDQLYWEVNNSINSMRDLLDSTLSLLDSTTVSYIQILKVLDISVLNTSQCIIADGGTMPPTYGLGRKIYRGRKNRTVIPDRKSDTENHYRTMSWATTSVFGAGVTFANVPYTLDKKFRTNFTVPANLQYGDKFLEFTGTLSSIGEVKNTDKSQASTTEVKVQPRYGESGNIDLLGDTSGTLANYGLDLIYASNMYLEYKYLTDLTGKVEADKLTNILEIDSDATLLKLKELLLSLDGKELDETVDVTDVELDELNFITDEGITLEGHTLGKTSAYGGESRTGKYVNRLKDIDSAFLLGILDGPETINKIQDTASTTANENDIYTTKAALFWLFSLMSARVYISVDHPYTKVEIDPEATPVLADDDEYIPPDENKNVARVLVKPGENQEVLELIAPSSTVVTVPNESLKVATWNLQWFPWGSASGKYISTYESYAKDQYKEGNTKDLTRVESLVRQGDIKPSKVKELLKAESPDIVCLQEILDKESTITLLQDSGYPYIVYGKVTYDWDFKFRSGLAELFNPSKVEQSLIIASKFPVEDYWFMDFEGKLRDIEENQDTPEGEEREDILNPAKGILVAKITLPDASSGGTKSVLIYNVHLKANTNAYGEYLNNAEVDINDAVELAKYQDESTALKNNTKRIEAAQYIFSDLRKSRKLHGFDAYDETLQPNITIILAGDFNTPVVPQVIDRYPFTLTDSTIDETIPRITAKSFVHTGQDLVGDSKYITVPNNWDPIAGYVDSDFDHIFIKTNDSKFQTYTTEVKGASSIGTRLGTNITIKGTTISLQTKLYENVDTPSISSQVIGTLNIGTNFNVLDTSYGPETVNNRSAKWYKIEHADPASPSKGWIHGGDANMDYSLVKVTTCTAPTYLNLRTLPNVEYGKKIAKIPKGATVYVIGEGGVEETYYDISAKWYRLRYINNKGIPKTGWAHGSYLDIAGAELRDIGDIKLLMHVKSKKGLYLMTGPSETADKIRLMKYKDPVEFIQEAEQESYIIEKGKKRTGKWYKVDHNDRVGWAWGPYLQADTKSATTDAVKKTDDVTGEVLGLSEASDHYMVTTVFTNMKLK